ncbi:unnamed protein product [Adineta ricciae]|uniref:Uncharacterized protein n=1 Tax=Adineta ricciae TaxID=249248 RepID=A0A815PSA5_ADIRI|nr:unnamed protein product [Adineta ricciae]CAF1452827.1 unnamed protein product [Adineta ricciae]
MGNHCLKSSSPRDYAGSVPALITYQKVGTTSRNTSQLVLKTIAHDISLESKRRSVSLVERRPSNNLRQYPRRSLIRNYIIIWLTASLDDNSNEINYLQSTFRSSRIFTNIDEFFAFILQIKEEKVFLILSESFAEKILSFIHETSQLVAIYVLSTNKSHNERWIIQYEKFQGIFVTIQSVCESIRYKLQLSEYNTILYEILNSSRMIVQYLTKQILLNETSEWKESRNHFLNYVRRKYPNELYIIEDFKDNYTRSNAIWWYTRKCFLYHALNQAFRSENFEELFLFGSFIRDVHQQLNHHDDESVLINLKFVYHGQGILENDLHRMRKHYSEFFTFKNFLWATTDKDSSLNLAQLARDTRHLCGVLFRIEVPTSTKLISLEKFSYYLNSKNDILFSIDSFFRIGEVKKLEEQLWQIDLTLITEDDLQIKDYLEQIEGDTLWQKLGCYLIELKQFIKAEELYQALIQSNTIKDSKQLALLHEQLGFIHHHRHDINNSLIHYKKALKYYLNYLPSSDSSLLPIYLNIGILFFEVNQSNDAIKHLKCALNIAVHSHPLDHIQISSLHHHLAKVYEHDGTFLDAIQHYQSALESELHHFPLHHSSIAKTYSTIGEMFYRTEDYSSALSYFDKTLEIQKKTLAPNHSSLAATNYNLARTLSGLLYHKEAIEHASQAVNIARHAFGSDHDDVRLYQNYLKKLRRKTLINVIPNGAVYE